MERFLKKSVTRILGLYFFSRGIFEAIARRHLDEVGDDVDDVNKRLMRKDDVDGKIGIFGADVDSVHHIDQSQTLHILILFRHIEQNAQNIGKRFCMFRVVDLNHDLSLESLLKIERHLAGLDTP